jgi:ribose/xylose/arabinose/galactoside ABC-type transport system permease subunit
MPAAYRIWRWRSARPWLICLVVIACGAAMDAGHGRFLSAGALVNVMQEFATIGPVALAVGLTMIAREFDLSVAGMVSLAGCVAVILGAGAPWFGLAVAMAVGIAVGGMQGLLITHLRLSSVAVTLGGLLTLTGAAYVLTGNATIAYARLDVAMAVNVPIAAGLSLRGLLAVLMYVLTQLGASYTRPGRDLTATGSDPGAARTAGVNVALVVTGVFALSGLLSATGGALLSYGLAAASPAAIANTLIPAVAAAIMGGVSLSGGKGSPFGIAGGVLILCLLRSSMSSLGLPPFVQDLITGLVLMAVALLDAEDGGKRIHNLRRALHGRGGLAKGR